ncbi:hypothetical protein ONZ45_g9955 [Pleurotus djamor]|nr:hypothetical protein ONZ45_g9955 [Pleurotus djamor]
MSALFKAVCRSMERIAPLRLAESWDNLTANRTLLLESPVVKPNRKTVLLTIDLTTEVLEEAVQKNTSAIVSYHPPLFRPLKSLTLSNPLQSSLLRCAAEGISIYSPHSALDGVYGGINDWLAHGVLGDQGLESARIDSLEGDKFSPTGEKEGGVGRLVTLTTPISMELLETRIKRHLRIEHVQVGYAKPAGKDGHVQTIAICAGSGGSMVVGKPADVYFTGEMSHHEVLASIAGGSNVILCGHTNTERGYLLLLAKRLTDELGLEIEGSPIAKGDLEGFEVIVSSADKHPLTIT